MSKVLRIQLFTARGGDYNGCNFSLFLLRRAICQWGVSMIGKCRFSKARRSYSADKGDLGE